MILIDDHEYSCESEICVLSSHVRGCEFFNHLQTCSNNKQDRFIFMPTSMFLGKFYIYIIIIIIYYSYTHRSYYHCLLKVCLKDQNSLSRHSDLSRGKRMNLNLESQNSLRFEKNEVFSKMCILSSAGWLFFMSHRSLIALLGRAFLCTLLYKFHELCR